MYRRPLALVALAILSAAGAVAVWFVALGLPHGRALDADAMQSFGGVAVAPLQPKIIGVAHLADPTPFLIGAALLVALALLRRRLLIALLVAVVLLAANLTTQLLKPALADLRLIELQGVGTVYPGSWPSGHATAAMSLALLAPGMTLSALEHPAAIAAGVGIAALALTLTAGFAAVLPR